MSPVKMTYPFIEEEKKKIIQKNIGPMIRIGREIQCLPYAGFFHHQMSMLKFLKQTDPLSS